MAKTKIEKEQVAEAIKQLKEDGKNPTIAAIRATLGNQGSLTTIQQFKKELVDAEIAAKDSPEALAAFRSIWSSALEEGRRQRDEEFRDLQETAEALALELKQAEGYATAHRTSVEGLTLKYEGALIGLTSMSAELTQTKTTSERNATKLVEALEQHQRDEQKLREQLAFSQARIHELELQLARVETKLEATKG